MSAIKEHVCKKISDSIAKITRDGRFVKRTNNSKGIFIHDNNRSQFIKMLADELIADNDVLEAINQDDLERIIFKALSMTQKASNMQDRASAVAKLILGRKQINKS